MRLIRCDACGAKAILAASQCPKCAEPLYVRNERGDEIRLVRCRTCDTHYPASRDGCRWCPAVKRPAMPQWTGKAVIAVLIVAAAWGGWQFLPAGTPPSAAPNVMMLQPATVPRLASVAVLPPSATLLAQPARILPSVATDTRVREASKAAPPAAVTSASPEPTSGTPQQSRPTRAASSTELVTAKATTWVNVRAEANSKSAIVGMILPDSIVELGESRGNWRRVSTRWYSGWASARLFTVDSLGR
jgi:hypothetical protein